MNTPHLLIRPLPRTINRFAALLFVCRQDFPRIPFINTRGDRILLNQYESEVLPQSMLRPAKEGVCEEADRSGGRALLIRALNIIIMVVLPLPAAECRLPLAAYYVGFLVRRFSYLWYPKGFRIFDIYGFSFLNLDPKGVCIFWIKQEFHFIFHTSQIE